MKLMKLAIDTKTLVIVVVIVAAIAGFFVGTNIRRRGSYMERYAPSGGVTAAQVHGVDAPQGRFPYVAQIVTLMPDNSQAVCTGFLVAPNVVLTAAHCFFESAKTVNFSNVFVFVGQGMNIGNPLFGPTTMATSGLQMRNVKDIVWAPPYLDPSHPKSRDFAFVVLSSPITDIAPVKVAGFTVPAKLPTIGAPVVSVGYGASSPNYALVNVLTGVTTYEKPTAANQPLNLQMNKFNVKKYSPTTIEVALTSNHSGTCYGDSGGPLVVMGNSPSQDVVIGILSAFKPSTRNLNAVGMTSYATCAGQFYDIWFRTDAIPAATLAKLHRAMA